MGSPVQIRTNGESGDAWSRIDPESVPPRTKESDIPLTAWEEVWYCLWIPWWYWWFSGNTPSNTEWGVVERFFFFRLGLPPKGFLRFWQFSLYLGIVLGVPLAVFIVAAGVWDPGLVAILGALTLSWALILYAVYFSRRRW